MRILIVCEHASNIFGGEAMLPFNYFRILTHKHHDVYLITHERVKKSLEQISGISHEKIFYVPDTLAHKILHKCSNFIPDRIHLITFGFLSHLITQFYQWRIAKVIVKEKKIEVIHEPAPVSAVQPSVLFGLQAPVVIGPMNGGMSFPSAFSKMAGKSEKTLYYILRFFPSIYNLVIPGKFFAEALVVANQRTKNALPKFRLGEIVELVENGVFAVLEKPKESTLRNGLTVLFVGRLVDWKAIDIAIDAINSTKSEAKLIIIGDGPLRAELEGYSKKYTHNRVEFLGLIPHAEINKYYDAADIFILPSIRECGGAVVLEAMARGLPVIATKWGGPEDYINEGTGFLIEPKSREYMVQEFSRVIDLLSEQPVKRFEIGLAGIKRVKESFMWDKKIDDILNIYENAIQYRHRKRGM